ncbi:MAG: ATP-binding protein [Bacteroidota bacterium]
MLFKNFRVNVVIRIIILAIALTALTYFVLVTEQYLRSVYLFVFIIIVIAEFVHYVDKTNRDFSSFLLAILQEDFSTTFSEKGKGRSFEQLYGSFNKITKKFKDISSEKEIQYLYLETMVEHVRVGILSFDEDEQIHLMNEAAKDLLKRPSLHSLQGLAAVDHHLVEAIRTIKPGENKLVKVTTGSSLSQLSLYASEFKLGDRFYKLVSLQDIKNELEANELVAWQKLIRVLTHEIMNSVTPITSLTATLHAIVTKRQENNTPLDEKTIANLSTGLDAIKNRSEGLQQFTEAYKNLTRLPQPKFRSVVLNQVLQRMNTLFEKELKEKQIEVSIIQENADMQVIIDPEMIEQVLINLIRNGIEALEGVDNPKIEIQAVQDTDSTTIKIMDNGIGMDEETLDKIFIPFYTTKKKGSGIGLALSRQILQLHKANITVDSEPDQGTIFTIVL